MFPFLSFLVLLLAGVKGNDSGCQIQTGEIAQAALLHEHDHFFRLQKAKN